MVKQHVTYLSLQGEEPISATVKNRSKSLLRGARQSQIMQPAGEGQMYI